MRRRVLLRDPASQSQCIFCTHKLLASSPYIRRRPFHSSRTVSKPPGTATAPQKFQDDGEAYDSTEPASSQTKNDGSTSGSAPGASFGRPAFGSKPTFAAAAPNFGRNPTFGASGPSFGSNKPTFGAGGFSAKPAFGVEVPIFSGTTPNSDIKPTGGIRREIPPTSASNLTSETKPTFKAPSFDSASWSTDPDYWGEEKKGRRGRQNSGSNLSPGIKPADGTWRRTAPSPGSDLRSDIRSAVRGGTTPKLLINYNSEIKPAVREDREEGRRGSGFERFSATPAFGGEREGLGKPNFARNPSFSVKPTATAERVTSSRFDSAPSSDVSPKSVQGTTSNPVNNPSFDVKPQLGRQIPSNFVANPSISAKSTNGEEGGSTPGLRSTINSSIKSVSRAGHEGATSSSNIASTRDKPEISQGRDAVLSSDPSSSFHNTKPTPKARDVGGSPASNPFSSSNLGSKSTFGGIGSAPAFGSSVKFGSRPSFGIQGGAAPNFGSNTSFGAKPTFGGPTSFTASQLTNPDKENSSFPTSTREGWASYAPGLQDMTSEAGNFMDAQEKEARERIMQLARLEEKVPVNKERVPVNVFRGVGPENTRAGRPVPYPNRGKRNSDYASKPSRYEEAEPETTSIRRPLSDSEERGIVRRYIPKLPPDSLVIPFNTGFKNTRIESWSPNYDDSDGRTYNQSENWTHLKKQQQESSLNQEQAQDKDNAEFVIARAEREKQAESRRYVPLANRPDSKEEEYQRQAHTPIRDVYGQTIDNREDQRQARYPRLDAYGQTIAAFAKPKVYDPHAPLGQNSTPISPGDWRDEILRRDDRLRRRRIYRNESDSGNMSHTGSVDERNVRYGAGSRTGGSYDVDGRQQPSREVQDHSRRWDENVEAQGTTRSTSNEYEISRGPEDFRPDEGFSRGGYENSKHEDPGRSENYSRDYYKISRPSEGPQRSENSSRGGYEISKPSEESRRDENSHSSYEVSRFSEEPRKPASTRDSQRLPSTYEHLPKGKQRDKARRRERFADNFEEVEDEAAARAELKRKRKAEKSAKKAAALTPILLPEWISVANLATALKVRLEDFFDKLEDLGYSEMSHDHVLGAEDAGLIAQEYGFEPIVDRSQDDDDLKSRPPAEDVSILPPRPPVVTIMGHVDHGKTTLLDWLRKSSIVDSEHGGITQHIGAFSVQMPSGKIITFLDTPGHAAFLSMRQRGANVTDIVILVVAADDSVKPQTIEAINHAKAAKVPVIVAINKVDKEDSNIERVKQDLACNGVEVEDFGGDTQAVCVSGKTGQGMQDLEEAVVTLSEILDMRAETDGSAEGWVIEASLKSMGKVATVLVKRGTMRVGDFIVAGKTWARIRRMRNEAGTVIEEAGPGTPVEIDGWREQPLAGDEVLQATDENRAKRAVDYRLEKEEREKMAADMEAINDSRKAEQEKRDREKREAAIAAGELAEEEIPEMAAELSTPGTKELFFIVKGDVSGSVEAVTDSINSLGTKEVSAKILQARVGQLTESDVEYAAAAKGTLINFNTDIDPNISSLAARHGVSILDHNIIYKLVDDVKIKMSEQLPPIISHTVTGEAEIAKVFDITIKRKKQKPIAGCKVRYGIMNRASKVRVMRNAEKVFDGTFASLKNVKKDVLEMRKGTECGIGFEEWADFQVGDLIQCYETIETKRYL